MLNLPAISKQHLIIFTPYPEPGKTKTRLIATLGTVGAANLQREMTEHTIFKVLELHVRSYNMPILRPIENCNKVNREINESFLTSLHYVSILKYQDFPEDTVHNKCYSGLVENQEADSLYQY